MRSSPPPPTSQEAEHSFWMDFERGRAVCVPAPPLPLTTFDAMMTDHHHHGRTTTTATATARQAEGAAVLLNRYWGALAPPVEEQVGLGLDDSPGGGTKGVGGPLPGRPPRPESYREDTAAASGLCACGDRRGSGGGVATSAAGVGGPTGSCTGEGGRLPPAGGADRRHGVCHELAAAAESGWDFSSRWAGACSRGARTRARSGEEGEAAAVSRQGFRGGSSGGGLGGEKNDNGEEEGGGVFFLCETATTSVVPVDLNAFLHRAELNIARLNHALASPPAGAAPETGGQPPLPRLLSLDDIQRRFLSRRRGGGRSSWSSSSSSSLVEKLTHQGEADFAAAADEDAPKAASPNAGGGAVDGDGDGDGGDGGDGPLPGGESLPLSRRTMLFLAAARARAKAMEQTMWDGETAMWRDLLLPTGWKVVG